MEAAMNTIQIAYSQACDYCGKPVADRDEMLCSACKVRVSRASAMRDPSSPSARLNAARRARDLHGEQCAAWDFESDGNCDECAHHRAQVKAALLAYDNAFGK